MVSRGLSVSGVVPQRVIFGHLDEDQQDTIGIDDMHLVQPPRFLLCLAGDFDARPLSSFSAAYTSRT